MLNTELANKVLERLPKELCDMIWKHYHTSVESSVTASGDLNGIGQICPYARTGSTSLCTKPCDDFPCQLLLYGPILRDAYAAIYFANTHFRFASPHDLALFMREMMFPQELCLLRELSFACLVGSAAIWYANTVTSNGSAFRLLGQAKGLKRLTIYMGLVAFGQHRNPPLDLVNVPAQEVLDNIRGLDVLSIQADHPLRYSYRLRSFETHDCCFNELDTLYTRVVKQWLASPRI